MIMSKFESSELKFMSILERLSSRDFTDLERRKAAEYIMDNNLQIMELPRVNSISQMGSQELINILKYCPESEFYYRWVGREYLFNDDALLLQSV